MYVVIGCNNVLNYNESIPSDYNEPIPITYFALNTNKK